MAVPGRTDGAAEPSAALRYSPLDGVHRSLGAKMVPFGGWDMPLEYATGALAEHMACRRDATVFDVSHLGTVRVQGPGCFERLQAALSNDLAKVAPGRAQYTHLLDEDGCVIDDIIVWWVDDQRFDVMPNASNTSRVLSAVGGEDVTDARAVLAVQGPGARSLLGRVCPQAAAVGRFRVATCRWGGTNMVVAGTGYTGEDGVECAVPAQAAESLWQALLEAGCVPAGLGARDTLRLEAGLPLHGHELGPGITPLEAGLAWVVGWQKPGGFRGRDALLAQRAAGVARQLRGVVGEGRQPLRSGYTARHAGAEVGTLTSGNYSPMLGCGIGMCFLPPGLADGSSLQVEARGRLLPAHVVGMPFVGPKAPVPVAPAAGPQKAER